ncbi:MAG TPA: hypothetical protein VI193_07880 [Acidimicrobiia bacterium]
MNSVGELLRTHPVTSALILVATLAILTYGTADARSTAPDVVNVFLIGLALLLMVVGAFSALVYLPTKAAGNENLSALMQWVEALSIYLIGWLGWFLFGLPSWLVVVGAVVGIGVLVASIATNWEPKTG